MPEQDEAAKTEADGGAGAAGAAGDTGEKAEKTRQFTDAELKKLLDGRLGEGAGKAERRIKQQLRDAGLEFESFDDLPELVKTLREGAAGKGKEGDDKAKADYEARLRAAVDAEARKRTASEQRLTEERDTAIRLAEKHAIDKAIIAACGSRVFDVNDVVSLTKGLFRLNRETEEVEVIDPKDPERARFVDGGKNMQVGDALDEWFATRPHYLRAEHRGGAGNAAQGGARTQQGLKSTYRRSELNKMPLEEKRKVRAAFEAGTVQILD